MVNKHGFTLVELLTSISIISILAGIGLPTLSTAREKAKRTICANNQRQIVMGMNMYAQDYDGVLPIEDRTGNSLSSSLRGKENWGNLIPKYVPAKIFYCSDNEAFGEDSEFSGISNFNVIGKGCLCNYTTMRFNEERYSNGFLKDTTYLSNKPMILDVMLASEGVESRLAHKGDGVNVGYLDGSVRFYPLKSPVGYFGITEDEVCFNLK